MPFTHSKPVLPVEMASSSEQPEINGTSEQEGKHSNILWIKSCTLIKSHQEIRSVLIGTQTCYIDGTNQREDQC